MQIHPMRRALVGARVLASVALLVLLSTACGGGGGGGGGAAVYPDPQGWGFNFYTPDGTFWTATPDVVPMTGGASTAPGRINVSVPGCTLAFEFDVQFSGSAVRLLLFRVAADSTCSPVQIQQATGTGTANADYGAATNVMNGTGTLRYMLGGNSVGGDFLWEAFLQV